MSLDIRQKNNPLVTYSEVDEILKPRSDGVVEVNPLLPEETWDYFCLDNVLYHGHYLTINWDKTGDKDNKGKGLLLFSDGRLLASSETLSKITGELK